MVVSAFWRDDSIDPQPGPCRIRDVPDLVGWHLRGVLDRVGSVSALGGRADPDISEYSADGSNQLVGNGIEYVAKLCLLRFLAQ